MTNGEPTDLHTVRILEFPIDVYLRATEALEGLRREFALVAMRSPDADAVPHRLERLIDSLTAEFEGSSAEPDRVRDDAIARGKEVVEELVLVMPDAAVNACIALNEMLDEADEFCRRGDFLLSLAAPPEAIVFRRWYLGEVTGQIGGLPPVAWPEVDHDALLATPTLRGT